MGKHKGQSEEDKKDKEQLAKDVELIDNSIAKHPLKPPTDLKLWQGSKKK